MMCLTAPVGVPLHVALSETGELPHPALTRVCLVCVCCSIHSTFTRRVPPPRHWHANEFALLNSGSTLLLRTKPTNQTQLGARWGVSLGSSSPPVACVLAVITP